MKRKLSGLSRRYVAALRTHLKQGRRADLLPAVGLGHRAVVLGVETLAMARIHERALAALDIAADKLAQLRRAEVFFAEAITPIVDTHRAARQSRSDLSRVNATLDRRTAELAASNHQLQRGILRRKNVETALKKSGEHYTKLLKDSLQLPDGLRHLTHKILLAQEKERQTLSQQLQNEIAQTLLGIQVRLLSLKTAAKGSPATLAKEIAGTQRLVEESVQAINRFARELDIRTLKMTAPSRRAKRPVRKAGAIGCHRSHADGVGGARRSRRKRPRVTITPRQMRSVLAPLHEPAAGRAGCPQPAVGHLNTEMPRLFVRAAPQVAAAARRAALRFRGRNRGRWQTVDSLSALQPRLTTRRYPAGIKGAMVKRSD